MCGVDNYDFYIIIKLRKRNLCFIYESIKMQKLIPAVDRVLSIIELLASEQRELSFTELSSSLNIPKPSLSRLLSNLQQKGYVSHNPATRKYQLTLKLLTLGDRLLDYSEHQ